METTLVTPETTEAVLSTESDLDYALVAREFLKALRGEMSQRELSSKLGYTFNQVGKWEAGHKQIKWIDFVQVANVVGVELESTFRYFFSWGDLDIDMQNIFEFLDDLFSLGNINPRISNEVRKWLQGKSRPDLADFLRIIDTQPSMLIAWVLCFVEGEDVPSVAHLYEEFYKRIDLIMENPSVAYVNAALQLDDYRKLGSHDEKLLAEHSCCSVDHLRLTLETLMQTQVISFDGNRYHPCLFDFSFSGLRNPKLRSLTQYTTQLAADKYPLESDEVDWSNIRNSGRSSVRVTALSASASGKIDKLVAKFHNEVGDIIRGDDEPKDHVQIILVHSFPSNVTKG